VKRISRRGVLGAGVAGVAVAIEFVRHNPVIAASAAPLKAVVTINSVRYEYREELGTKLGDFVANFGRFTQSCVRTIAVGSPLTVYFRPDRDSDRTEVVFELGRMFNAVAAHLGAYTVTISRGDQILATVNVPVHHWFSRWRWQSAPRPIVGKVAALIEQKLLPPYVRPPSDLLLPPSSPYVPYTVMGLAGVTPYMPGTGERPDIGLVTESQAKFICTANKVSLDIVLAQAEAAGSMPWHMRDENTGAPINFQAYPKACWYQGQKLGTPFVRTLPSPVNIDESHQPALAYVPYLLTGDPYYLEELQFQATWNYGSTSVGYRPTLSQTRQFAWSMRTLGQCARVTPAVVPSWLLNRSYWSARLTAHRIFFENSYVNRSELSRALFRATDNLDARPVDGKNPAGTWCEPWQSEFLAAVFGWLVSMGQTEWRKSFDWVIGGTLARTNNTSGWPRAQSTPYEMMLRASKTAPFAQSWDEAWLLNQNIGGLTYLNSNTWTNPTSMTYLAYTRGALIYASLLKMPVSENLAWATGQLNTLKWKTAYKWRLGNGLS
jgi:hypothetical protein